MRQVLKPIGTLIFAVVLGLGPTAPAQEAGGGAAVSPLDGERWLSPDGLFSVAYRAYGWISEEEGRAAPADRPLQIFDPQHNDRGCHVSRQILSTERLDQRRLNEMIASLGDVLGRLPGQSGAAAARELVDMNGVVVARTDTIVGNERRWAASFMLDTPEGALILEWECYLRGGDASSEAQVRAVFESLDIHPQRALAHTPSAAIEDSDSGDELRPLPVEASGDWTPPGVGFRVRLPEGWRAYEWTVPRAPHEPRSFLLSPRGQPLLSPYWCDVLVVEAPFTLGRTQAELNGGTARLLSIAAENAFGDAPHDTLIYEIRTIGDVDVGVFAGQSDHPDAEMTWFRTSMFSELSQSSIEAVVLTCVLSTFRVDMIEPMNTMMDSLHLHSAGA